MRLDSHGVCYKQLGCQLLQKMSLKQGNRICSIIDTKYRIAHTDISKKILYLFSLFNVYSPELRKFPQKEKIVL